MEHLGAVGTAQVVKLAHNLQVGVGVVALAETLQAALRSGADPHALARCLRMGVSLSRAADRHMDAMLEHQHRDGAALAILAKDVHLAVESARANGSVVDVGAAADAVFQRGIAQGLGTKDVTALMLLDGGAEVDDRPAR